MTDITMCNNWDCPNQDNCWRFMAPPDKFRQAYADFKFDENDFENGGNGCEFYIATDEMGV